MLNMIMQRILFLHTFWGLTFIFLWIVPWAPGGTKFCRNPTPPAGVIDRKLVSGYALCNCFGVKYATLASLYLLDVLYVNSLITVSFYKHLLLTFHPIMIFYMIFTLMCLSLFVSILHKSKVSFSVLSCSSSLKTWVGFFLRIVFFSVLNVWLYLLL